MAIPLVAIPPAALVKHNFHRAASPLSSGDVMAKQNGK